MVVFSQELHSAAAAAAVDSICPSRGWLMVCRKPALLSRKPELTGVAIVHPHHMVVVYPVPEDRGVGTQQDCDGAVLDHLRMHATTAPLSTKTSR